MLIGGTEYAGEMKKSIFTILNYLLPLQNVLSMHCSANYGPQGDVAIFFGLSGTGKTTLSSDPARTLIGDDEHGWSDHGVFNFEGGCYAKVIRLSADRRAGNLRGLPPLRHDPRERRHRQPHAPARSRRRVADREHARRLSDHAHRATRTSAGVGGHPKNIIMLTADAFGVMPPIARLTPAQAQYYFLSGYTAKVAGTERGVTEPQATFSTCFGAPFIVHPPTLYARLLGERIAAHGADAWLVNTGWTGGPAGGGGSRMSIAYTRAMVAAALDGSLANVETVPDPVFGVGVPVSCPGVPPEVLQPRSTWDDPAAYDAKARELAEALPRQFRPVRGRRQRRCRRRRSRIPPWPTASRGEDSNPMPPSWAAMGLKPRNVLLSHRAEGHAPPSRRDQRPVGAGAGGGLGGDDPLPGWLVVPLGLLCGAGAGCTPVSTGVPTVTLACPLTAP